MSFLFFHKTLDDAEAAISSGAPPDFRKSSGVLSTILAGSVASDVAEQKAFQELLSFATHYNNALKHAIEACDRKDQVGALVAMGEARMYGRALVESAAKVVAMTKYEELEVKKSHADNVHPSKPRA